MVLIHGKETGLDDFNGEIRFTQSQNGLEVSWANTESVVFPTKLEILFIGVLPDSFVYSLPAWVSVTWNEAANSTVSDDHLLEIDRLGPPAHVMHRSVFHSFKMIDEN